MRHDRLDADRENWAVDVGVQGKGVVKENNTLASGTLCRGCHRCPASHSGDGQSDACRLRCLQAKSEGLRQNPFLALGIKVSKVCGGKILALREVCLLLLPFGTNTLGGLLGILLDPQVAGIWALHYMDPVFKE